MPGRCTYTIENIVFDYNGTIAANGIVKESVKHKIRILCKMANVYVLTADTYGSAEKECSDLNIELRTFPQNNVSDYKCEIVKELGSNKTVCFGNGYNDIKMLEAAALSIAVIGEEGMCSKLLEASDIVVKSIEEGMNLLINQKSLIATLRA